MGRLGKRLILTLCALFLGVSALGTVAFAAEESAAVIPVGIRLEGAKPQVSETFVVELIPESTDCPMPGGSENGRYRLELTGESSGSIRIPCDQAGVFAYTIRQIPGKDPNCTYDSSVYDLTIFVTRSEYGGMDISAVVYGPDGGKLDRITFRNFYANPDSVTITAIKTLDGKTPKDGAFSFRLLDEAGNVLFETENDGTRVTFPTLHFDEVGIYRYYLKEVKGEDDGIIYDRTVYTITVEVTKDSAYHAKATCERNGKAYTGMPVFANYTEGAVPKTGDSIGIYVAGLTLSAAALILLLIFRRRK